MSNEAMNPAKKHFLLPLLIITLEQSTRADTIADLFIFLVQYSFLCNESASGDKILKRDFSYFGELSSQKSNGARYLDPKYSRWISVDPALGEYIPAAGKGNSKNAGNLPGMGGIYNHINGDLYHYAGNNPVRYIDPDGREDTGVYIQQGHEKTFAQKIDDELTRFFYRNILGGGAYNADGTGDKLIRTMDGRLITLSRSGEKYFSNSEKNIDRLFFLVSIFGSELGLLSKMYFPINVSTEQISNFNTFKSAKDFSEHYERHGSDIAKVLGRSFYSKEDYLADANYIIQNGNFSSELNGYVKFMSGKKYGFVGLDRETGKITTFHIKTVEELARKAPSLGINP